MENNNNRNVAEEIYAAVKSVPGHEDFMFSLRRKNNFRPPINHKGTICLTPDCGKFTYDPISSEVGGRGLCRNCYSNTLNKVKRGKLTWEELETKGLARPKMTNEERNKNQSHPHRRVKAILPD